PRNPRISLAGKIRGFGKRFENCFDDMMRLIAVEQFEVQIAAGFIRKSLKKFSGQTEPEGAGHILIFLRLTELLVGEAVQTAPDKVRPPAEINNASREAFVHRNISFGRERVARVEPGPIAANPFFVPERARESLAQDQAAIFDRMMGIDAEITPATKTQIHDCVPGE